MLDETNKNLVKANFDAWLEILERKSELSKENKAITDDTARILETKPALVGKMFRILKKRHDEAVDELEELSDLMDEVFE